MCKVSHFVKVSNFPFEIPVAENNFSANKLCALKIVLWDMTEEIFFFSFEKLASQFDKHRSGIRVVAPLSQWRCHSDMGILLFWASPFPKH